MRHSGELICCRAQVQVVLLWVNGFSMTWTGQPLQPCSPCNGAVNALSCLGIVVRSKSICGQIGHFLPSSSLIVEFPAFFQSGTEQMHRYGICQLNCNGGESWKHNCIAILLHSRCDFFPPQRRPTALCESGGLFASHKRITCESL